MKKIKFLGAAVLAASLIFAGCSSPAGAVPEGVDPIDNNNQTGENNNGQNNNGQNNNGENNNGENNNGQNNNGQNENNNNQNNNNETGNNETGNQTSAYAITFSDAANSSTYADDVYTVTLATPHGAADEWGNQIFIKNPNAAAGVKKGDLVKASVTVKADKEITTFFFKNQYNGGNYTGTDTSINLPANTEKVVQVVGTVTDDYDDSSSYVIAIRGNEANTTLTIKDVKSEVLTNYEVTSVTLTAMPTSISSGETSTITLKDQYGIAIAGATYEITSESASSLSGNVLAAGDKTETVTVKATYGNFEETITIEVSAEKNYAKYWAPGITTEGNAAPTDYFSIWADQNWCGSQVTLSDMSASENGVSLTQAVNGNNWFGTQIWYGLSAASDVSFKVTSSVAGDITINTTVYTLEADVEQEITLENVSGKIAIQLGKEADGSSLGNCTFTITDFSVTPVAE